METDARRYAHGVRREITSCLYLLHAINTLILLGRINPSNVVCRRRIIMFTAYFLPRWESGICNKWKTYVRVSPLILCYPSLHLLPALLTHSWRFNWERTGHVRTYVPVEMLPFAIGNYGIRGIMIIDDFPESTKLSSFIRRQFVCRTQFRRHTMCDCICTHPNGAPFSRDHRWITENFLQPLFHQKIVNDHWW